MKNEVKLSLLKIIQNNSNLSPLVGMGYDYKEISDLITLAAKDGLIINNNGQLELTDEGVKKMEELTKVLKKHKSNWIVPQMGDRIEKISEDFIYLPNKDHLSFKE